MSIYSGFSTRNQEAQYNRLTENLLSLMQSRIIQHLKSSPNQADLIWVQKFNAIYSSMKYLETHKYLEPKFSESCRGLASYFSLDSTSNPIIPEFDLPRPNFSISKKGLSSPRKKYFSIKPRQEKPLNPNGVSKYYGQIMDKFLTKPKSVSSKKKTTSVSIDSQDFWLLDDNIRLIEHEQNLMNYY